MTNAPGIKFQGTARIGERILFDDLSFDILPGQINCLLGASGVGKSTILRLIADLDTGAEFDGSIKASDDDQLPARIGYMAQGGELFPWLTVFENVVLGARLRQEKPDLARAKALIEEVGLSPHITKKPSAMSGGERQRIALARTLMEDRSIILLDEPFSALDAKTRSEMQELTGALLKEKTVLLVTHDPVEAARLGHKITVMTEMGLRDIEVPSTAPVREIDDPETLSCQGQLYRILREEPA